LADLSSTSVEGGFFDVEVDYLDIFFIIPAKA
jgi:hypothetical protein